MRNMKTGAISCVAFMIPAMAVALDGNANVVGNGAAVGSCTLEVVNDPENLTARVALVDSEGTLLKVEVAGQSRSMIGSIPDSKATEINDACGTTLTAAQISFVNPETDDPFNAYATIESLGLSFFIGKETITGSVASAAAASQGASNLEPTITAGATRQLTSQISSNQRLVRESRGRFIESRRQMDGDGSGLASRNIVDFDVDGTFNVDNGRVSTNGSFFEQTGNFEGTYRRLFFGDFDVQHDSDTDSTTATLSGKIAWELMLNDANMLGYFLGGNLAYSDIGGAFSGEQQSYGVSAGAYFVSALQDNLFLDGFLSVGAGHNELELSNSTLDLKGDYESYTTTVGLALSGVIEQDGFEIRPEIALSYGYTDLGTIGLTDRNAGNVDNRVTVDADSVSIANLTIRPEFRVPMDGLAVADSRSLFTFAPRLICEQVDAVTTTEDCGGGAEIGFNTKSSDGKSRFVARLKADRIASSTRTGLELKLEHRF